MNSDIDKIKGFRQYLLQQIDKLTPEQLNETPKGFNNNIIWNIAHTICAQQTMCYVRASIPPVVDDQFMATFLTGTRPTVFIGSQEIQLIKETYITTIEQLRADYQSGVFRNYSPSAMIPKVYGFEVTNIDEAIAYLLYHEGYHTGCILSLKKLVDKPW